MKTGSLSQTLKLFMVAVLIFLTAGAMAQVEQGRFVGRIADPQDALKYNF